jgi:hypothetical protein
MPRIRPPIEEAKYGDIPNRIAALETNIRELIEERISLEAAECPGVPRSVVAQLYHSRMSGNQTCWCGVYRKAFKDD